MSNIILSRTIHNYKIMDILGKWAYSKSGPGIMVTIEATAVLLPSAFM